MEQVILSNKKSIKNTIARTILLAVAVFIGFVFLFIYYTVKFNLNYTTNHNLDAEIALHQNEVSKQNGEIILVSEDEWNEAEHNIGDFYPIYLAIYDANRNFIRKSENLEDYQLKLSKKDLVAEDILLDNISVRKKQTPLYYDQQLVGYAVIGIATNTQYHVLKNLKYTLSGTYTIVLILLYFLTRKIAGASVAPTLKIINQTKKITENNFKGRIDLPKVNNELFDLTQSINQLLTKVEKTLERQKQFTADASHQLKTPLAILKGNLEVLIRKPRSEAEYHENINYCIAEIDKASSIVDQLLFLARIENKDLNYAIQKIALNEVFLEILEQYQLLIIEKNLKISFAIKQNVTVNSIPFALKIILENIISNAIKYSYTNGEISITIQKQNGKVICSIQDFGIGISQADQQQIFDEFYRSQNIYHCQIQGNGLGLSIVKKLADILKINIEVKSQANSGTIFILSLT
ncbi:HAMP domain-containing histidine kinase [Flavobacterium agricola]|uniref:histidine kinase n=1 Tax=Flavobacterium agricola TaxID=2870839 RepID=A0ABY6LXS8_9FLAO|nr:HAMP domain-containing sensor histidine kinase [Flavobacterium agricola]UYW01144.1 HAMP domain-containing histidine kinase [Flavobacterium agricola]